MHYFQRVFGQFHDPLAERPPLEKTEDKRPPSVVFDGVARMDVKSKIRPDSKRGLESLPFREICRSRSRKRPESLVSNPVPYSVPSSVGSRPRRTDLEFNFVN